ncbi:2Fe-2S iron-sulfur cluster-binding protein [Blastococcus sp. CT_GayMR16]|uniref:2Fe-2S iron-sulfur cluster-binding protein n=1 Tax=Blastococcus sp. CT_GayMR16 TaxID=2559607 RepID=UPI001073DA10|nr:2Fe-2S iron-sulfur cluster-binding protein [Blastococcus sp. CT_GayMR16]TFV89920.1 2Fe-2S iron-sulfur cluster binding domain-containing protein [Blastococcus sp. CT_GayMR16]
MIDPQFWWYLARATGFVAWGLLTVTVVWGLLLRTRLVARWVPWAWTADVHRFLGILAVIFTGLHVTGLLLDDYVQLSLTDVAVPFAAAWQPVPVALGVIAGYLMIAVVGSSLLMRRLPRRWWHRIHLTSYLLFWLATMHGITAGTDSGSGLARAAVAGAIVVVLLLTLLRTRAAAPLAVAAPPVASGVPRFHPLTVAEVRRETPDAVSVAFSVPAALASAYRFQPGQYLLVRTRIDGALVSRSYSICSGITDGELRIAVRQVPAGRMSTWITTALRTGDVLDVAPPAGTFTVELNSLRGRHILGVAAGSGITPVLSIISSVLATEPASRCTLIYGNRTPSTTLFAARLTALEDRHPGRLRVIHVRSREAGSSQDLRGHIDASTLQTVHADAALSGVESAYVCGPAPMTAQVQRILVENFTVNAAGVHTEVFTPTPAAPRSTAQTGPRTVVLRSGGRDHTVAVAPGETVLDAGLRAGLDLPYSCRAGICGTCTARTSATASASTSLPPAGDRLVLTCQMPAPTGSQVIDFDTAAQPATQAAAVPA